VSRGKTSSSDILDPKFEAPTPRASFQMLTTVALALRERLDVLAVTPLDEEQNDTFNWLDLLASLTPGLKTYLSEITDIAHIEAMWTNFLSSPRIAPMPKAYHRQIGDIAAATKTALDLENCVEQFREFNRQGHALARSVLDKCEETRRLGKRPAEFSILFDEDASYYCAATTRADKRIRWAHQPVEHALYAALVPELVFAHEYFSHLAPANRWLSRAMTEAWLVEGLMLTLEHDVGAGLSPWRKQVWGRLRDALVSPRTSPAAVVERVGFWGVARFAAALHGRSSDAFWRLTRIILTAPDQKPRAEELDSLMVKLIGRRRAYKVLAEQKWSTLSDLWDIVDEDKLFY